VRKRKRSSEEVMTAWVAGWSALQGKNSIRGGCGSHHSPETKSGRKRKKKKTADLTIVGGYFGTLRGGAWPRIRQRKERENFNQQKPRKMAKKKQSDT